MRRRAMYRRSACSNVQPKLRGAADRLRRQRHERDGHDASINVAIMGAMNPYAPTCLRVAAGQTVTIAATPSTLPVHLC